MRSSFLIPLALGCLLACRPGAYVKIGDTGQPADCVWYRDVDGDGFGDATTATNNACNAGAPDDGYVTDGTDCNDSNDAVNPAAAEVCNGVDDDCDGVTDPSGADGGQTWYLDEDADSWGDSNTSMSACDQPSGWAAQGGDCVDDSNTVYPGATEFCDFVDNDCDGLVDNPADDSCLPADDGTVCGDLWGADLGSVPAWGGACDGAQGYIQLNDTCYYVVWDPTAYWPDARATCANAGGWLATPTSSEETEFLAEAHDRTFVGGCDADEEGTWSWVSGELWDYTTWDDGKPDSENGDEDCMVLGAENHWNDIQDDVLRDGFICEFAPITSFPPDETSIHDDGSVCAGLTGSDLGEVPAWDGICDLGAGQYYLDGRCYLPVQNPSAVWTDARTTCANAGGWLVSVTTEAEKDNVAVWFAERFMVGACDADAEGVWTWVSGEEWDYSSWAAGKPDSEGGDEDCVVQGSEGDWNDVRTDVTREGYVCEFKDVTTVIPEGTPSSRDDGTICPSLWGTDLGDVPTWSGDCTVAGFDSYDGHCYYAVSSGANWPDARATCAGSGGYLATVTDDLENDFVTSINSRPHLGGCDGDAEGTWTWITNEDWDYANFASGEPNDYTSGEDCLEDAYAGLWNDIWCGDNPYTGGYVCEFE